MWKTPCVCGTPWHHDASSLLFKLLWGMKNSPQGVNDPLLLLFSPVTVICGGGGGGRIGAGSRATQQTNFLANHRPADDKLNNNKDKYL